MTTIVLQVVDLVHSVRENGIDSMEIGVGYRLVVADGERPVGHRM
jgi:tryptophan synthase alpha subunit